MKIDCVFCFTSVFRFHFYSFDRISSIFRYIPVTIAPYLVCRRKDEREKRNEEQGKKVLF